MRILKEAIKNPPDMWEPKYKMFRGKAWEILPEKDPEGTNFERELTAKEVAELERELCEEHEFRVTLEDVIEHQAARDIAWLQEFFYVIAIWATHWVFQGRPKLFDDGLKKHEDYGDGYHFYVTDVGSTRVVIGGKK